MGILATQLKAVTGEKGWPNSCSAEDSHGNSLPTVIILPMFLFKDLPTQVQDLLNLSQETGSGASLNVYLVHYMGDIYCQI